jgi:lactate dehydrogenase-like 2-hydroxyacid dehydrogenase
MSRSVSLRGCSARATPLRCLALRPATAAANGQRRCLSSGARAESESVGFVGLGKIGFAMARNMMKAGHSLTVFDVDPDAVDRLVAEGATAAGSAAEAAAATSRLVTVLPNDAILHQVVEQVR